MGWASAGQIFDRVTHALIDANASDDILNTVCYELAKELKDGDWDTVDESIHEFSNFPTVVAALRRASGWSYVDEEEGAILEYDARTDEWTIAVAGRELGRAPGTAEGHDRLVRQWFDDGDDTEERREQLQRFLLRPEVTP